MIHTFIQAVRSRLNLAVTLKATAVGLCAVATGTLITGGIYISQGYAVPTQVYSIAAASVVLLSLVLTILWRKSTDQAAHFADAHFKLKDALTSSLEFEGEDNAVYTLQRQQTAEAIQGLSAKQIAISLPRGLTIATLLTVTAAGALAFVPASQRILDQQEEEQLTELRTEKIQKELENYVEELIESLSDDEKEAVSPEELRKWVKDLKQTSDKREALRDYARLEQKIQKTLDKLDQRKDEELLKNAGIKLEKAKEAQAKEMGKSLKDKDFKAASEKLKEFKLSKKEIPQNYKKQSKPKDLEKFKNKKIDKKKLAEKQKKLAKLRSLTKRLAAAARQQQGRGKSKDGKGNQSANNANGQANGDNLDELLDQLDQAAEELEEMLEEMELGLEKGEELNEDELQKLMEALDGDLAKLSKRFKKMDARRKARSRMKGLSKALGLAQSYANGQSAQLRMPGGKKPGIGTDNRQRKEKDALTDNGLYDKIKGQKGKGQSLSSIESAQSGTGTSKKSGTVRERSFQKQMDAFVEREDIPEEMKAGIKEYFKNIHQSQTQETGNE